MAAGKRRALVRWTRLLLPDGVSVPLASLAADNQGRVGVPGRVDNHFVQRFASALLQTTMNIGGSLVSRSISREASVIIALPGSTQGGGSGSNVGAPPQPTLRVDAGAVVTVLVAQDLEF